MLIGRIRSFPGVMTTCTGLNVLWKLLVKCDSEDVQTPAQGHTSLFGG